MRKHYEGTASPPPDRLKAQGPRPERFEGRVAAVALAAALAGCVTVKAPDKPIVIELNVNIRQEVIYRLAADAKNTVENNKDIF